MYLSQVSIENYRMFSTLTTINFRPGLNLLVGENGCGKSSVIDAIRVLLNESEYSRHGIGAEDFFYSYRFSEPVVTECIRISGIFSNLTEEQKVEYLTWLTDSFDAKINLEITHSINVRNNYKQKRWGGNSSNSIFDWEPLNDIQCVYLPALRDADRCLRAGRGSRLARFIINLSAEKIKSSREKAELMPLEKALQDFNEFATQQEEIKKANELINSSLEESAGNVFGQKTQIQFNTPTYERIVESLQLLFSAEIESSELTFRNLSENSLGYNNLIYIATILAEFEGLKDHYSTPRILLIEELEAHLHPQLQIKLLKYLQQQANNSGIQVIISTHSPTLVSSVPIDCIISFNSDSERSSIISLKDCGLDDKAEHFINRWMDATKAALLFSKGNIFVEGIAEAIIVPKLAEIYLKKQVVEGKTKIKSLEEAGISVVNMNGIYFMYFMQLYNGYQPILPMRTNGETKTAYLNRLEEFKKKNQYSEQEVRKVNFIPGRNVALTDNDPAGGDEEQKPAKGDHLPGANPYLYYGIQLKNMTDNCRVFVNEKTFEYDLALESHHNAKVMLQIILDNITTEGAIKNTAQKYIEEIDDDEMINDSEMAFFILKQVDSAYLGKGLFAQILYEKIDNDFTIPSYIGDAFDFILRIGT